VDTLALQPFLHQLMQLQSRLLAMSPETRLKDVLRAIAEACNEVLRGDFCVVQPYDQTHDRFLAGQFTAAGLPNAETFPWTEPRPDGATRAALAAGLLTIEDYAAETTRYPFLVGTGAFRAAADVRAAIGVRLQTGHESVGVLFVTYLQPHHFTAAEVQIARLSAHLAAIAIRNARLLELNAAIGAAQELIREALRPAILLDAFLAEVVRRTQELVPFDVGWLLLREGDRVRVRATDQAHLSDLGTAFPVDDCISGLSMSHGEPINIPDLAQMPEPLRRVYKPSRSAAAAMRSELVVPLLIGGHAIGALSIESRQPAAFEPRHVEMLTLLGDHAALAIELARSRQEAAALSAIGLELARETAVPAVVRLVLEHALALIEGRFGQLLLSEGPDLVVHYTTNLPPRDVGLRVSLHQSVSGLAVQERKPVIVPDVTRADYVAVEWDVGVAGSIGRLLPRSSGTPRYQRVLEREKERVRAELAAPLWAGSEIAGVLNVETPREAGFDETQRGELGAFARAAGRRFAEALAKNDQAQLRSLLDEALGRADTTFGQLLQIAGEELVIAQTTGGEPVGTRVPIAASVSGQAVSTRRESYVPDVDQEPRYRRYLGEEMKSELAVPLISGEEVIGVLNLESPVPAFFTSEHARILQALAGQAAVAIERARRTEVERLAAIGGLAGDIVHRLNNPIAAVNGWLAMLKRQPFYPELTSNQPYVAQFVMRVERDVARAVAIIQELRAELRRQTPTPVVLQSAIGEALERCGLAGLHGKIRLALELPLEPVRVLAGPSLGSVFWNLFDNAAKAMPDGGTLSVSVRPAEGGGWRVIQVADTGVGIEPWRLPFIFEAGASTTADSYAPIHGLGLWWTRSQIESFGGAITADSSPSQGTRITIRLRAAP